MSASTKSHKIMCYSLLRKKKSDYPKQDLFSVSLELYSDVFLSLQSVCEGSDLWREERSISWLAFRFHTKQHTQVDIFDFKPSADATLMNAWRCHDAAQRLRCRSTMTLLSLKGLSRQGRMIEPQGE